MTRKLIEKHICTSFTLMSLLSSLYGWWSATNPYPKSDSYWDPWPVSINQTPFGRQQKKVVQKPLAEQLGHQSNQQFTLRALGAALAQHWRQQRNGNWPSSLLLQLPHQENVTVTPCSNHSCTCIYVTCMLFMCTCNLHEVVTGPRGVRQLASCHLPRDHLSTKINSPTQIPSLESHLNANITPSRTASF